MDNPKFWQYLDRLVAEHELIIDRPKHTFHPTRKDMYYELDYGYLDGTTAVDGEGLDVWVGSCPQLGVVGVICTVDMGKEDAEMKILLGCTEEDLRFIDGFYNGHDFLSAVILRREEA